MSDALRIKLRIEGRVQRVWFRGWTVQEATRLGLDGWVRNCADGSVEAVFSGPGNAVRLMIERCWQGPPHANVTAIKETPFEGDVKPGYRQV